MKYIKPPKFYDKALEKLRIDARDRWGGWRSMRDLEKFEYFFNKGREYERKKIESSTGKIK